MISDVVDDTDNYTGKKHQVCRTSTPWWQQDASLHMKWFIMAIAGDGDESNKENMLGEKGDVQADPADGNGSKSDYSEKYVEEVNKPNTSRGRGHGQGRKSEVVVVVVVEVRGAGTQCWWRTGMWLLYFYLSDASSVWYYFKLSAVNEKIVKLVQWAESILG